MRILPNTISALKTLPSGYHSQAKKIHSKTKISKITQTPKITGRDSKSNYFYWSSQARILLLLCRLRYLSTWLKWILFFWLKCTQNYKSMCKTEDAALQQGRKTRIKQASRFWSKPLECCRGRGIRSWSHNKQSLPDGDENRRNPSAISRGEKGSIDRV